MFFCNFLKLRDVEEAGKVIEVKHVLVFAVLAKERNVLTEVHVFEVICDKASVAALNTLAELFEDFGFVDHS